MKIAALVALLLATTACGSDTVVERKFVSTVGRMASDSMGALPSATRRIKVNARRALKEASAAVITRAQPGIVFTINDSGNDADLFAIDTTGRPRGVWRVTGATNNDWEALASGPCASAASSDSTRACLYIADTGDNGAVRKHVALYRIPEPVASRNDDDGTLSAEKLSFRYADGAHDVEAVYATRAGDVYLITKRALHDSSGRLRPSLVFLVPASAWGEQDTFVAQLVDSLPIVPGSNRLRQITDASLSEDSRLLAVRTYGQVFIFAADTATGRVTHAVAPAICNIQYVELLRGEGISWFGATTDLLLNSEGRDASMHRVTCPLPSAAVH